MQDANAKNDEFRHELNIAIALREIGKGCEGAAAALERGDRLPESTIAEMEQATTEVIANLRTLLTSQG